MFCSDLILMIRSVSYRHLIQFLSTVIRWNKTPWAACVTIEGKFLTGGGDLIPAYHCTKLFLSWIIVEARFYSEVFARYLTYPKSSILGSILKSFWSSYRALAATSGYSSMRVFRSEFNWAKLRSAKNCPNISFESEKIALGAMSYLLETLLEFTRYLTVFRRYANL